ncbi:MAG: hypothetical protein CL678_15020 [Bdellovibrionaceae bacterium]|nr:hypothetical protein [Pseudobdellovibrionaceae bacterium]|tara:strand:+ start:978 stop:1421 length:444 start_codon:yes stop_codon:yes gene_type:complete
MRVYGFLALFLYLITPLSGFSRNPRLVTLIRPENFLKQIPDLEWRQEKFEIDIVLDKNSKKSVEMVTLEGSFSDPFSDLTTGTQWLVDHLNPRFGQMHTKTLPPGRMQPRKFSFDVILTGNSTKVTLSATHPTSGKVIFETIELKKE